VVRPSYVLGGRAMEIVYGEADLARYVRDAVKVSNDSPVLLDRFLDNAVECDVDIIADKDGNVLIGGVMEHIEEAGVHSGDSSCSLPPYSLSADLVVELKRQTALMARALKVVGLMNVQFAIQQDASGESTVFVLEVNPRASRTVPFVSKATGIQLAKVAAVAMVGVTLAEQGVTRAATIDEVFAEHLGRAFGSEAVVAGERAIAVGRDGRLSGPGLAGALIRGLASTGLDVVDIGASGDSDGTVVIATEQPQRSGTQLPS
jgi:carbamoylphosphate synthase large subunit